MWSTLGLTVNSSFTFICQVRLPPNTSDDVDEDPTGNKALWDRGLLNGASQKVKNIFIYTFWPLSFLRFTILACYIYVLYLQYSYLPACAHIFSKTSVLLVFYEVIWATITLYMNTISVTVHLKLFVSADIQLQEIVLAPCVQALSVTTWVYTDMNGIINR